MHKAHELVRRFQCFIPLACGLVSQVPTGYGKYYIQLYK